MNTIESMPRRPLTDSEVDALAAADGIEAVEAVAFISGTRKAIAVGLVHESENVLVGYHPERYVWEVVERWDRERES